MTATINMIYKNKHYKLNFVIFPDVTIFPKKFKSSYNLFYFMKDFIFAFYRYILLKIPFNY